MKSYSLFLLMLIAMGAWAQPLVKYDKASKKYSYGNEDGSKLSDAIYDYAEPFLENDRAAVQKDGKWFFINKKMEAITPLVDSIDLTFQSKFEGYLSDIELFKKDCCWYLYNIKTKKASPGFSSVNQQYLQEFYLHNTIVVNTTTGIVLLDINKLTTSPEFDSFYFDPYYHGLFKNYWMKKDGRVYKTNKAGVPVQGFDYVEEIDLMNYETSYSYKRGGSWGLMINDKPNIKYEVKDENYFGMPWNEQYIFKIGNQTYFKDGLYGKYLIDVTTLPIVDNETEENHITGFIYYNKDIPILFKREKFGFMDLQLNVIIPATLDSAYEFDKALHAVVKQGKNWGVIDITGKYVVDPQFELLIPTRDTNIFIAKNYGKYGLIHITGETSMAFENDYITEGLLGYMVQKNGKYGLISTTSLEPIINYTYDHLKESIDYCLLFKKGDKKGVYDLRKGRELFSGNYKNLERVSGSSYLFHQGEKWIGRTARF